MRIKIIAFLMVLHSAVLGQVVTSFGPAFPQDEVTVIRISIDPDSLNEMLVNLENEHEYPASFIFESSILADTIDLIGLRLRGNTSLGAYKKSFKIEFDAFDNNTNWQGLDKLNLLGQINDPSMMRSKLCYDAFRQFGIPCARTSYTQLFINDEYRGLYLNVEQIDEQMADLHFDGQGDGNIYKCTYPATLEYLGDNPDDYKIAEWGTRHYELQNNNWRDDYSDLAIFIDVLVNTPADQLHCELPRVFNVEDYLKTMALEVLLGSWDGYIYLKNNYYLYHDQHTDQIRFIPYDLDNSLGLDWLNENWTTRDIYNWSLDGEERPLYTRLMQNDTYRDRFSYYIELICNEYFNSTHITELTQNWQNLISESMQDDIFFTLDFGFTYDDFLQSASSAWGAHVPYGILDYVESRRNSALQQLENYEEQDALVHWQEFRSPMNDIVVDAHITGPSQDDCIVRISSDGNDFQEYPYEDISGINQIAGDDVYTYSGAVIPADQDKVFYQVKLPDGSLYPCAPQFYWNTPHNFGLVINEVMVSNATTITDESGDYDDWIELYNTSNQPINLADFFLTDRERNWNKFPLPEVIIPAHGFQLIWLDSDPVDGDFHATFRASSGESFFLFTTEENEFRIADETGAVITDSDISWERTENGGMLWSNTTTPTPGYSNILSSVQKFDGTSFNIFPNPTSEIIFFSEKINAVQMVDCSGRTVAHALQTSSLNVEHVSPGIYFLKTYNITVPVIITR